MTAPATLDLPRLHSCILRCAERIQTMRLEWKTGIYPAEMAVFLGMCEYCGIRSIVESGRGPDAYSTHVLGQYADETGSNVISLDFAAIEKRKFGYALKKFSHLQCLTGNVAYLLPKAMKRLQGHVALLVDGPKEERANCLTLCACIHYDIRLIAHHNAVPEAPWTIELRKMFPGLFHFEDLGLESEVQWNQFRNWEREAVSGYEVKDNRGLTGRSLSSSSLALSVVPSRDSLRSWKTQMKPAPLPFRPWILLLIWRILSLFA